MNETPDETTLLFTIERSSDRSVRAHPEALVRQVLDENNSALAQAMTAGALTIAVISDGSGIEFLSTTTGLVRFMIGGRKELLEEARFFLDWEKRTLELRPTTDSTEDTDRRKIEV